jgi:hypothetical protein
MSGRTTLIERAFQLARSGDCPTVSDLRKALKAGGYDPRELYGPELIRQLRELCQASRTSGSAIEG